MESSKLKDEGELGTDWCAIRDDWRSRNWLEAHPHVLRLAPPQDAPRGRLNQMGSSVLSREVERGEFDSRGVAGWRLAADRIRTANEIKKILFLPPARDGAMYSADSPFAAASKVKSGQ